MNCINRDLRIVNCETLTVTAVSSRWLSITVHCNTLWHVNNVASWLMQPTRLQLLAWWVGVSNELLMTSTPSGDCVSQSLSQSQLIQSVSSLLRCELTELVIEIRECLAVHRLSDWSKQRCYSGETKTSHVPSAPPSSPLTRNPGSTARRTHPLKILATPMLRFLFYLFTSLLVYFLTNPTTPSIIYQLRFQAGGRRKRPNLALVYCVNFTL